MGKAYEHAAFWAIRCAARVPKVVNILCNILCNIVNKLGWNVTPVVNTVNKLFVNVTENVTPKKPSI